jgi:8-oxo-dGTP pyrophosphatase MutT (NUDIX family)
VPPCWCCPWSASNGSDASAGQRASPVSPLRPDLVDCWIFRVPETGPEILLIRRSPGRILPGLWQCVSGSLEPGERVAMGALRELDEETGFAGEAIEHFYDLDLVNQFHEPSVDGVVMAAVFAVRVHHDAQARLSHEHDGSRWLPLEAAHREVIWPGYREAIGRIRDDLLDPSRSQWFELDLAGRRLGGDAVDSAAPSGVEARRDGTT